MDSGAGVPGAGDTKWYGMYKKILDAGKSAQILGVSVEEAKGILENFGTKGIYVGVTVQSDEEADEIINLADSMR